MRRTLVLGLDGATFRVLDPLIERGHLPNLATLREQGASGVLESTMPPVTGPAWLSLATGLSPGSTGVYDFIRRAPDADSYDFEYIDSGEYRGRAVWDHLGDAGIEVGVVDYPTLAPPYDVNGFMLSGGLGASDTNATPEDLQSALADLPDVEPHIDISDEQYRDLETFADAVGRNLAARADRLERVLTDRDWQFCWAVLQEPDWVQHLMWKCFDEDYPGAGSVTARERELFVEFWQQVDDIVGQCRDFVGDDGNLVVQSDHGFGPMYNQSFHLNTWLKNEGYLVPATGGSTNFWLKKRLWNLMSAVASAIRLQEIAPSLFRWGKDEFSSMGIGLSAIDTGESLVFDPGHIQSMGGLYVNDSLVTDEEHRTRIVAEVREKLATLADERDLPLETHTPEKLYGKRAPGSPDLLVRIDGVNVENAGWDKPVVASRPDRLVHQNGSHRKEGVFIASGPDFEVGTVEGADIWDLAPTILHLFDQPVPEGMDGRVLTETLSFDREIATRTTEEVPRYEGSLKPDEQESMAEQLRDLGYFE